jgi:hypothetical protein
MATSLLSLRFERQPEFAVSTLYSDDRRLVESCYERIRHWYEDEDFRTRSRKLKPDEELYMFEVTGRNLLIFFQIDGDTATIMSVVSSAWLQAFQVESSAQ